MGSVVFDAIAHTAAYGIVCLTGVSAAGRTLRVDAGATSREIVLDNDVVVGSVNANLRHYQAGVEALATGRPRLVAPARQPSGSARPVRGRPRAPRDDIKVVIDLT